MTQTKLIILIAICLLIIGGIGYFSYVKFFNEDGWLCQNGQWVKHGNPSDPQPSVPCVGQIKNNQNQTPVNTNNITNLNQPPTINPNIKVDFPKDNDLLINPATISGQAKLWYFEGSFPYKLLDENGKIIATGQAQAQGDWTVIDFVSFKATMNFIVDKDQNGTLILEEDNPSGRDNPEKIEIPVKLQKAEATILKVYFPVKSSDCGKVLSLERKIPKTTTPAKSALEELIKGPTEAEYAVDYISKLSMAGHINKVNIRNGVAYADLPASIISSDKTACELKTAKAQIVQTLKQFSSVQNVLVTLDGTVNKDLNDLKDYTEKYGRSAPDIQSIRTYQFSLPTYMNYNAIGEDASSGYIDFIIAQKTIFRMYGTDYTIERSIYDPDKKYYAYSTVGGHTNVLELLDKSSTEEIKIFLKTFTIDGKKVFN